MTENQIQIRDYDVYFPDIDYEHSVRCVIRLKRDRELNLSVGDDICDETESEVEKRIEENKASLEDFYRIFGIIPEERTYAAHLSSVERSNMFNNFKYVYKATNQLRRSVVLLDDAREFVYNCLRTEKGKVEELFIRLYELISQVFKIIQIIQDLRRAQEAPVFSDLYAYIKSIDIFQSTNVIYLFKIMRKFKIFNLPQDDIEIQDYVQNTEDLALKTLLGVGKLGKLMHVGILRMLNAGYSLNGCGMYYYALLEAEDDVLCLYDYNILNASKEGLEPMTVRCSNRHDIFDLFPIDKSHSNTFSELEKPDELLKSIGSL